MHIVVKRESGRDEDAKATCSAIEVYNASGTLVGEYRGLEPDYDSVKEYGDTRIPEGTYQVGIRHAGAMTRRYRERFLDWFQGMLHILNVSNYENVYIHIGNYPKDTEGCLLVGRKGVGDMVTQSTAAFEELYKLVIESAKAGELTITYVDNEER